jgi:radical SAM superfamily enzyme YgiQ (UPF0313 family)
VRLLLINPRSPESFWNFRWGVRLARASDAAINPPLGLATLAALCPADWQVTIVDENVEPVPLSPAADLIGVAGMGVQFARQKELLRYYRERGYFVVAGGSFASLCPERYAGFADTVVCGEAESIWPRFCRDFERGEPAPLYRETQTVDLRDSPVPRFDLLNLDRYSTATVQFSRGCPYLCEFCDIIVMFGRKPRHKTPEQIGRELDRLRELGVHNVFFVDDNLIGDRKVAKTLLRFLAAYQREHRHTFRFGTEASINLAADAELMALFRAANFQWVFIGIESPDPASLRETRKLQNVREDPLDAIRRIHANGIEVLAGFIVGFDNDTLATFERQYEFIMRSGIQAAMIGLLNALPRTPLHARLERANRLREHAVECDNTKLGTNVVPLNMSYATLVEEYRRLYRRLVSDAAIGTRIANKMRDLGRAGGGTGYGAIAATRILLRFSWEGLLRGGPRRIGWFLRSVPWRSPSRIPVAISDWIVGLSMRDYVDRHFGPAEPDATTGWEAQIARLSAFIARSRDRARLALIDRGESDGVPVLTLSVYAGRSRRQLARAARHLRALLAATPSKLRLRVVGAHEVDVPQLRRMLRQLAEFGDRISIELAETLHQWLAVDMRPFELILPALAPEAAPGPRP